METKKVLVTGAAGFIGSNVCLALQDNGHQVTALDNFSVGVRDNLKEFEGRIIEADIRKFDWEKERFDAVIHEGAITDTTVKDRNLMLDVNVEAFKKLTNYCEKKGINLVYASSAAVYGRGASPMKEDQDKDILSHYAESKLEMDKFVAQKTKAFEKEDKSLVGLRYFNVCGPREKHKNKMASMIWQLYLQMKEDKRPKLFKHGEHTRDHVYVKDAVKVTLLGLKAKQNGVYNAGSGKGTTFNEIVEILNKNLDKNLKPDYIDNPHEHYQNNTIADLTNTKKQLGYNPEFTMKTAIPDYLSWIQGEGL